MKKFVVLVLTVFLLSGPTWATDPTSGGGTVAETMNVGNYVYVRLAENDMWLASSPIQLSEGDRVTYSGCYLMKDFYSPKLERQFPNIIFVSQIEVAHDPHANIDDPSEFGVAPAAQGASPQAGEIDPLPDGYTVAGVYEAAQELAGKTAALRARVVKVSANILGKNWVTVQDGTGTAPRDKLVATTTQSVAVGNTVVVTGTVKNDVDIGAGYTYEVILEDATFTD